MVFPGNDIKPSVYSCGWFTCILPPNPPVARLVPTPSTLSPAALPVCLAWSLSLLDTCLSASAQRQLSYISRLPLFSWLLLSLFTLLLLSTATLPAQPLISLLCSAASLQPSRWLLWHLPFRQEKRDTYPNSDLSTPHFPSLPQFGDRFRNNKFQRCVQNRISYMSLGLCLGFAWDTFHFNALYLPEHCTWASYLIQVTAGAEEKVNECSVDAICNRSLWSIMYSV